MFNILNNVQDLTDRYRIKRIAVKLSLRSRGGGFNRFNSRSDVKAAKSLILLMPFECWVFDWNLFSKCGKAAIWLDMLRCLKWHYILCAAMAIWLQSFGESHTRWAVPNRFRRSVDRSGRYPCYSQASLKLANIK